MHIPAFDPKLLVQVNIKRIRSEERKVVSKHMVKGMENGDCVEKLKEKPTPPSHT